MIRIFIVATFGLLAADWENLREVTRDRNYWVVLRDGRCLGGRITSVDSGRIVFGSAAAKRPDILRIAEQGWLVHDAIYSGRSSWSDVRESGPFWTEYLLLVTKRGEQRKWPHPKVADSEISYEGAKVEKADIATVSYIRFTPLTEREQYFIRESATFMAPRTWFHGLMLSKIAVTLYNSSKTEDDSPVACH